MQITQTRLKTILPITAIATCALLAANPAYAKEYEIKGGKSSGSSITSLFNYKRLGGDSKTSLSTFQGKDSLGDHHGQIVADYDTGGHCSAGPAFSVAISQGVLNYKQGQLFIMATSSSVPNQGCLASEDWTSPFWAELELIVKYEIVGGTGDYEGASGELTSRATGTLLYNDLSTANVNQFGSFESHYEGWFVVD